MNINTKKYIEEFLKIRNKNSKIVPFILNKPQKKLYEEIKKQKKLKKPVRIIILKARQMGFSTLTEAILFKETATKHNVTSGIIAHEARATNNLFNMSKLYYDNLPEAIKPKIVNRNAQEIIFNTKDNKGLNSRITCMTASESAGRSGTYNFLHLSEYAFWEVDKKEAYISLMQAVPNNPESMVVIESTANGFEDFKELWDKAVNNESDFIPIFIGWNELEEYQMPYTGFELDDEEKRIKAIFNLTNEQLEWRRWCIRNNCGGDIKKFKQEYPISPEEAFLNTGNCVFDTEVINNRLQEINKPIRTGYFTYEYDDTKPKYGALNPYNGQPYKEYKISNIKWQEDEKGYIKIYEMPNTPEIVKYAIGGDTAGEGSDYFTAHVINAKTLKQCAVFKKQLDPDLYAKQMYCLGMYYNKALIGIENNFDKFPVRELSRLGYQNQYIRKQEEKISQKTYKEYGFRTDLKTRPAIISYLKQFVREQSESINDRETLNEMLQFITNEAGRPEAQQGAHDDLVMGLAIALRIVQDVTYNQEAIVTPHYNLLDSAKYGEIGDEIQVI